jgi:hypothetical protein
MLFVFELVQLLKESEYMYCSSLLLSLSKFILSKSWLLFELYRLILPLLFPLGEALWFLEILDLPELLPSFIIVNSLLKCVLLASTKLCLFWKSSTGIKSLLLVVGDEWLCTLLIGEDLGEVSIAIFSRFISS